MILAVGAAVNGSPFTAEFQASFARVVRNDGRSIDPFFNVLLAVNFFNGSPSVLHLVSIWISVLSRVYGPGPYVNVLRMRLFRTREDGSGQ